MQELVKKLAKIQKDLKANKSQFNKFGNYAYRNAEDILESLKPHLGDLIVTINDDVVAVGDRIYVKSTSTITDGKDSISTTAFAREPEDQKGMSAPQITGSASSYASKYSLGKLFLLDDTKDADSNEQAEQTKGDKPNKFGKGVKTEPKAAVTEPKESPPSQASNESAKPEGTVKRSFRRP